MFRQVVRVVPHPVRQRDLRPEDVADRVVFMDHGSVVEEGAPRALFRSPTHARTRAFLRAVIDRQAMEA